MTAQRSTATLGNGGSDNGITFADALNAEIVTLWNYAAYPLINVAGSNAITATSDTTIVSAITSYSKGMKRTLIPAVTNTTAVTINIDNVAIANLTDQDGIALVSGALVVGRVYGIEYDGSRWRIAYGLLGSPAPSSAPGLILRDEKTTNTAGGTFTAGSYVKRTLNTVLRNVISGASLSNSQFTLPAGTFYIEWDAPAYNAGTHVSRLFNVTDGAEIRVGSNEAGGTTAGIITRSRGNAVVTTTTAKTFEIDHICGTTRATDGFGVAMNLASAEVYTSVNVWVVS